MIETEVGRENCAHFLTEADVHEARQLATRHLQRLRGISETETSLVYFLASDGEHFASSVVRVFPTYPEGSRHPSYEVFASYEPCCKDAEADHVDGQIRLLIQLVYDTYIQAVRLNFTDKWYGYP